MSDSTGPLHWFPVATDQIRAFKGPDPGSVVGPGRGSYRIRDFVGPLHRFPAATDRIGAFKDPDPGSVVRLGRSSYRTRDFIGSLYRFPMATDRIERLCPRVDQGLKRFDSRPLGLKPPLSHTSLSLISWWWPQVFRYVSSGFG